MFLRAFGRHANQIAEERVRVVVSAYEEEKTGVDGNAFRRVRRQMAEQLMRRLARVEDVTSLRATAAALDFALDPFLVKMIATELARYVTRRDDMRCTCRA